MTDASIFSIRFFVYHKEGGIDGIPGETRPFRHRFTSMQW
jgi:hypothetical protein